MTIIPKKRSPTQILDLIDELSSHGIEAIALPDGKLKLGGEWEAVVATTGRMPPGPLLLSAYRDAMQAASKSLKTPIAFYSGELWGLNDRVAILPAWAWANLAAARMNSDRQP